MDSNKFPAAECGGTSVPRTFVNRIEADGISVFYREAGAADAPVVLLLHGFPASSFQYRELIPRLADRYRVIAPDLPGFGFTEVTESRGYKYTFDALAETLLRFTDALGLTRYALYIFDYGAPTGLRLAMARPARVTAIVSQNGNAYEEGLGDAWAPIRRYWNDPSPENRDIIRQALNLDGIRREYSMGIPNPEAIAPEGYTLDAALMARPGNREIQLDLFLDYANNVKIYPKFQEYFRQAKPPLLAIWGRHDPYFVPAGAEAFRRDIPDAVVQLLDTGHFALETHVDEIALAMRQFLAGTVDPPAGDMLTLPSAHSAAETAQRLISLLNEKKIEVFADIDHAQRAREAGLSLRPTRLLIFGNPKAGTPLMQSRQTIGLDLPLRVLIWEDEAGQARMTWHPPELLAKKDRAAGIGETAKALGAGLAALVRAAASL